MTADIKIINAALALLNQPAVSSLADSSRCVALINRVYDESYTYLLSMHPFSFSVNVEELATVPDVSLLPKYVVAKAKPSGALFIIRVMGENRLPCEYRIIGDTLQFRDNQVHICEYVKQVEEHECSAHFRIAFSYYLAYRVSNSVLEAVNQRQLLYQEFERHFMQAKANDSVQSGNSVVMVNHDLYSRPFNSLSSNFDGLGQYGYPAYG